MSPEALALGLLSAVRGVQLAIVYTLLLSERPRPLLVAYLAAGISVTLGVGIVVVVFCHQPLCHLERVKCIEDKERKEK